MILTVKVKDNYRHIIVWLFREYIDWDEIAVEKNTKEGDYIYFTGMEYDSNGESLVMRINANNQAILNEVNLKIKELEKLEMISDVIIDGN